MLYRFSDVVVFFSYCFVFFFFFQAEDGIRDHCVTGVQTCALPISGRSWSSSSREGYFLYETSPALSSMLRVPSRCSIGTVTRILGRTLLPRRSPRSEERRVGKECRSRWSPYD